MSIWVDRIKKKKITRKDCSILRFQCIEISEYSEKKIYEIYYNSIEDIPLFQKMMNDLNLITVLMNI